MVVLSSTTDTSDRLWQNKTVTVGFLVVRVVYTGHSRGVDASSAPF